MKPVIMLIFLSVCLSGYAQVVSKSNRKQSVNDKTKVAPTKIVAPGTYQLAPDKMPCVVPDMATVKRMPNSIKAGDEIPFISNGYRRNPVIVLDNRPKTDAGKLPK
jgi:hypothetical protein